MSGIIAGNTPQMLIWACDGRDHPDNLPLPSGAGLNYYQTLLKQCEIAKKSETPIYLIYSSSLLTEKQTQAMEHLANKPGFENLFVQDYEDFKTQCFVK
ncbi:hypothetical protein OAP83_03045 [Rickettsiales bacterium]|nr:hypothetical protein [Rickettsiales bacterium]